MYRRKPAVTKSKRKPGPSGRLKSGPPTSHPPGSEGKIQVLERRASLRLALFHPDDAPLGDRNAYSAEFSGGEAFALALLYQSSTGELETIEEKRRRVKRTRTTAEIAAAFLARERDKLRKRLERRAKRLGTAKLTAGKSGAA